MSEQVTGLTWFFFGVAVLGLFVAVWLFWTWRNEVRGHASTRRALERAMDRLRQTDVGVAQLAAAVVPLVEQTDWMTGRWGGKFNEVVRMENQRNQHAVAARKVFMSLPAVTDVGVKAFDPWDPIGDLPLKIEKIDVVERRELGR